MIGWALRWVVVRCGFGFVCAVIMNGGSWLPPLTKSKPDPVISAATRADPSPAASEAVNTLVYPVDARGHILVNAVVNGAPVRFWSIRVRASSR